MGKRWTSKAAVVLGLLLALALAGCDLVGGIPDPLIGSWTYTNAGLGITDARVMHANNTWARTYTVSPLPGLATSGTYTHDSGAGTMVLTTTTGGSGAHSYTYTVSSDRKTLTIVDGIITTAYTRN